MESVARHLDESTQFFVQHDLLRERVARADAALDRRIAEAVEAENVEIVAPPEDGLEVDEAAPITDTRLAPAAIAPPKPTTSISFP